MKSIEKSQADGPGMFCTYILKFEATSGRHGQMGAPRG